MWLHNNLLQLQTLAFDFEQTTYFYSTSVDFIKIFNGLWSRNHDLIESMQTSQHDFKIEESNFKLDKEISYISKIGPRPNAEDNMFELCGMIFLSRISHPNNVKLHVFSLLNFHCLLINCADFYIMKWYLYFKVTNSKTWRIMYNCGFKCIMKI